MSSMDSSTPPVIEPPRSPYRRSRGGVNTELYAWLFMRVSGVVLVVLAVEMLQPKGFGRIRLSHPPETVGASYNRGKSP
jgi:hypothetical protein